jgi:hypothetical protein
VKLFPTGGSNVKAPSRRAEVPIAYWQCLGHAKCLIRQHRLAVERVARALLERETLSGAEIDKLMTA